MTPTRAIRTDPDRQKKIILVTVFVLLTLGIVFYETKDLFIDPTPTAPPPAAAVAPEPVPTPAATTSGNAARSIGNTSAALDPTLHMDAMLVTESVSYTGSGRNIFAAPGTQAEEPTHIATPIASVRPHGPDRPVVITPSGPPPPPPIPLKFFGVVTRPDGSCPCKALLVHDPDVFIASSGDIVQHKYRIVQVDRKSLQVEDMTNNNRQTLPLQTNP
jgi:hypothetical protein